MAFWNEAAVEPKRSFKFLLDFGASNSALPAFIVKKCDKPGFDITTVQHEFLGHKFNYPGKVTWNDITAAVIDPGGTGGTGDADAATLQASSVDVAEGMYKVLIAAGYQSPIAAGSAIAGNAASTLRTLSKGKATNKFNQIKISQLDADGKPVEVWTLNNAFITSVKFGSLAYAEDSILEIGLTFKYDWADLQTVANNFDSSIEP